MNQLKNATSISKTYQTLKLGILVLLAIFTLAISFSNHTTIKAKAQQAPTTAANPYTGPKVITTLNSFGGIGYGTGTEITTFNVTPTPAPVATPAPTVQTVQPTTQAPAPSNTGPSTNPSPVVQTQTPRTNPTPTPRPTEPNTAPATTPATTTTAAPEAPRLAPAPKNPFQSPVYVNTFAPQTATAASNAVNGTNDTIKPVATETKTSNSGFVSATAQNIASSGISTSSPTTGTALSTISTFTQLASNTTNPNSLNSQSNQTSVQTTKDLSKQDNGNTSSTRISGSSVLASATGKSLSSAAYATTNSNFLGKNLIYIVGGLLAVLSIAAGVQKYRSSKKLV
jgi:hypothetical protein